MSATRVVVTGLGATSPVGGDVATTWNAVLEEAGVDPERLAVVVASGIGGVHTLLGNYDALRDKGPRRVSPLAIPMLMPNGPAASIGLTIGAKAGVHTPVSACASGNEAVALGIDLIRLGRADVGVVGGHVGA